MDNPNPTSGADTVLIADDEPHIRHLVGTKLKMAGYTVLVASNGQDCLDLAREHHPELIVTDYQMPVLSGFEMSQALAADHDTASIPVILLTARGHKLSDDDLATTSIRMVIDKPFGPTDLINRVKGMLEQNKAA
ncbi:MAG: response regulator [Phycisphaeraceae bacterium]|nr:response regulator [Phycisphaeraceae bacterium]